MRADAARAGWAGVARAQVLGSSRSHLTQRAENPAIMWDHVGSSFSRVSVLQGGGHAKAEAQREGHASAGRRVAWGTSRSGFAEGSRRPAGSGTDQEGLSLRALGETTAGDALL